MADGLLTYFRRTLPVRFAVPAQLDAPVVRVFNSSARAFPCHRRWPCPVLPIALQVLFHRLEIVGTVPGFNLRTVLKGGTIGLEGVALLDVGPGCKIVSKPVIVGRRVNLLADALPGKSARDGSYRSADGRG